MAATEVKHSNNRNRNLAAKIPFKIKPFKNEYLVPLSSNSPIMTEFGAMGKLLLERQDRHERLVKLSRDITIESKRIIFLLHSPVTIEKSQKQIINEAKQRIEKLINGPMKAVAMELENVSAYLHSKAITAGLQEFVEARTFCTLIEHSYVMSLEQVRNELTYKTISALGEEKTISIYLPPLDYMLGLADLSGEVMRKAISDITIRDFEECFFARDVLQQLYCGFLGLWGAGQAMNAKLNTTRANVQKVEQAWYSFIVRGSEFQPNLERLPPPSVVWDQKTQEDEGFC